MAEDSADHDNAELIAGLEEGDLKPNFYEGGFKTWECALDLAKLVASESAVESLVDSQTNVHIIEACSTLIIDSWSESLTLLPGTARCRHCSPITSSVCPYPWPNRFRGGCPATQSAFHLCGLQ